MHKYYATYILCLMLHSCSTLPPFVESVSKKDMYHVVNFLTYIQPGMRGDDIIENKSIFYAYIFVPEAINTIGVRLISPVDDRLQPGMNDFVDSDYLARQSSTITFHPSIILQQCTNSSCDKFQSLAEVTADTASNIATIWFNQEQTTLPEGLYRIAFFSADLGAVQGTLAIQVGFTKSIKGVIVARHLDDLLKARAVLQKTNLDTSF